MTTAPTTRRAPRLLAAAAAVGTGLVLTLSAPAGAVACYPPTAPGCVTSTTTPSAPSPTVPVPPLVLSTLRIPPGGTVTVSASGFRALSTGIVTVHSVERQVGTFTADSAGNVTVDVNLPADLETGAHTLYLKGTARDGGAWVMGSAITVPSSSTGSSLPKTGVVVVPLVLVGIGLVGAGQVVKRAGKRAGVPSGS